MIDFQNQKINYLSNEEYKQIVNVNDILSYHDLYRHSINEGNYVLVPKSCLKFNQLIKSCSIDEIKPFMTPFCLAQVLSGFEERKMSKILFLLILVNLHGNLD